MLGKYIAIFLGWSLLIGGSLAWNLHQLELNKLNTAASAARASLTKDIFFREWASSHEGVYVRPTLQTPPNPHLKIPDRDVITTTGIKLTLMNPAYVIREVQEYASANSGIQSHLTSLKLINPKNAPDEWEIRALKSFDQGNKEALEVSDIKGKPHLRLMLPLPVTQDCLKCHGTQLYKVGDIRGGISASVLLEPYTEVQLVRRDQLALSHGGIWFVGILGLLLIYLREKTHLAERKIGEARIHNLAFYDPLTQLPNRRQLIDKLKESLSTASHKQYYSALLFIDLDNFKNINDTMGHDVGDLLLTATAKRIQACIREVDTVARLGGDDFVVLLAEINSDVKQATQTVALVAEKIRASLTTPYRLNNKEYLSSTSIGVSLYLSNEVTESELLKHTEMALYRAKESGRNAVRFFDTEMQLAVEARAALEADLRHAVPEQQLQLYYQIQMDNKQRPIGAEALVRWHHPTRGIVPPVQFISLAEESSLILEVGDWVMETACHQLLMWSKDEQTKHLTLAVNVSAKQFKQPDFVEKVKKLIQTYELDISLLKIELTETVVLNNITEVIAKMHALKALGVRLSMDDFGTGYSSLSYLKQLPMDQIKIDQSFVRDMTSDQNDQVMVQTIIDMAKNFHLNVIAEGVETEAQQLLLKHMGCMAYQGYFFSKPVPIEQFEALVKQKADCSSRLPT